MDNFYANLGFTDLISEIHKYLRADIMKQAHERLPKHLSEMELYLLNLVEHQTISISEAAREMGITRQGAHKSTKHLLALGYVECYQKETNKREKYLTLTPQGRDVHQFVESLKTQQEEHLKTLLGTEKISMMKEALKLAGNDQRGK
jgi:DNA-binding MarR family transcriptional regulator